MTTLQLIRHGKASPGTANYDELHTTGEAQARLLGEYFRDTQQHFDALYCGPLVRQRETLRIMREAARDVGARWPEAHMLDGLAEAPIEAVVRQCLPVRMQTDTTLQSLVAEIGDGSDKAKARAGFERVLDHVTELWSVGELGGPGIETASEFAARVVGALDAILAREGEGRAVAVVTSNGVIGYLVAHAAGETRANRIRPMFWNSSRTELSFRAGRLAVERANLVDHLRDGNLHTLI